MKTLTVYSGNATTEIIEANVNVPDPRLTALAAGTVLDLGVIQLSVPAGEFAQQARQVSAFSGWLYDRIRFRIVLFGGGHAATNYDSIWTLGVANLVQAEEYPPTAAKPDMIWDNYDSPPDLSTGTSIPKSGRGCWIRGSDAGPYPRAAARHTEDLMVIIGDELTLFGRVEGNGINTQGGGANEQYFSCIAQPAAYNFTTKTWRFITTAATDGANLWGSVELDPISGKVVWINQNEFNLYDPATSTKTNFILWNSTAGRQHLTDDRGHTSIVNTIGANGTLSYDSIRDAFYYFEHGPGGNLGTGAIWKLVLDRSNPANTILEKQTTTGSGPTVLGERCARFNANKGVFGCGPFANVFYEYEPVGKVWSSHPVLGGAPGSVAFHCLDYVPEADCYFFKTDSASSPADHVYALKSP